MANKAEIKRIVSDAIWESAGMGGFMRCKGCGCYMHDKEHWQKDCPYGELNKIVEKALKNE